ncbi:MerR family transcriptional regulator [Bacillus sp. SA1-12]|uniref:MerR family transcriptional regulator n=1 Tax=Bacillus sp. SA1-12 TaxID=1455638 RepID=UPI000626FDB9|nr:MerR family transcriptional regulator [Bacillus sp. SA1-12]KKI90559.1 MerR family transcriptional regulator [Bacillus sp. SA1-12]
MSYTIGQASEKTGLSIHTLRYYEREGIMPNVNRNESGIRLYETKDLEALEFICCLRATGMTISDIKQFVRGSTTIDQRIEMLEKQQENVKSQVEQFMSYQVMINRKIDLYRKMRQT